MKKTALDWLKAKLEEFGEPSHCGIGWNDLDNLIEKAKKMEKKKIADAYDSGMCEGFYMGCNDISSTDMTGEQFFKETYQKK